MDRVEWEEMSVRVICFTMIKARVKGKVLNMVVRPAVMETVALTKKMSQRWQR